MPASSPRLLITGASGLLGHELCGHFAGSATILRQGFAHAHADTIPCDLREPRQVRILLEQTRPDVIIHAAAYREPDYCEEHPQDARALNVGAVESLAHGMPRGAKLVFISTDYVFSGEHPPYTETTPRGPLSEYGRTKAAAEAVVEQITDSLIVRIPVLIGADPRPNKPGFLQQMVQQIRSGHPAVVDDVLVRHPTWTGDVARALEFLLERGETGFVHVSSAEGGTRYALTQAVAKHLGLSAAHLTPSRTVVHRAAVRPHNSQLSSRRLLGLGFPGFTPLTAVVDRLIRPA